MWLLKLRVTSRNFEEKTHEASTLAFITSVYSQNYANELEDYRRDCHVVSSAKNFEFVVFEFQHAVKVWQAKG